MKKKYVCSVCGSERSRWSKSFCSVKCQRKHQYDEYIKRWKKGLENGRIGLIGVSKSIRKYLYEKYESKCCKCGWGIPNPKTGKVILDINHKNGDWKDNREKNLELICCNCHTLTPNYKALNIGKGRYMTPGIKNPGNNKIK